MTKPRFEEKTVRNIRAFYMNNEASDNGCEAIDKQMPDWTEGQDIQPVFGHYCAGIEDAAPVWATTVIIEE